ncbi:hypothetical protein BJ165DRAFT_1522883 [Panaeolus papilionaceus]|nr:hypothetical protein BJ165DRAFT_1522883 [Panaeolus papilionaceus]
MPSTKGNKALVVLAQKLTEEVDELKSRIHELEAAIETARLNDSSSNGSQSRFPSEEVGATADDGLPGFSNIINELVAAFPLGKKDHGYSMRIFELYMPLKQEALHSICCFYEKSSYISSAVSSDDFFLNILNVIYPDGEAPCLTIISPHSLSIFFATVALGILCDKTEDGNKRSERYHNLARAALSFQSLSMDASCATIQAVFLITRLTQKIHSCVSEECWLLNGLNNRLIHKLGLHQEGQDSAIFEHERQAARRVFWEVVTWDAWACFISDRPGYFSLKHVNCPFPTNTTCQISGKNLNWSIWRYNFITSCLTLTLDYTLSYQTPPYSAITDVDNKIRTFPLPTDVGPSFLQSGPAAAWSSDTFTAAQEYSALCVVEATIICLHKKYFQQAMSLNPDDPFSTEYQFSVRAILHSASRTILGVTKLRQQHADELDLTWFLWASVFTSTSILRDFVIHCPRCPASKTTLQLYEKAMALYEDAMSGVSEGPLTKLRAFFGKACSAMSMAGNSGSTENILGHTSAPYNTLMIPDTSEAAMSDPDFPENHLGVFGGQASHHDFQNEPTDSTCRWLAPHHNGQPLNLQEESTYGSIYVPESEFRYQQQWDATQQWEDFVAAFKVPDHEF